MGYIGLSRSQRSSQAIEDYEVPLNHFNRSLINNFIDEYNEFGTLKSVKISLWKFTADRKGASSWHHTGSYYNKTNHYDIYTIAEELLENLEDIKSEYKEHQNELKKEKENIAMELVVSRIQIWGGSRKHPKLVGQETVMGLEKNGWLIPVSESEQTKYKLSANKVEQTSYYASDYKKLCKDFPQFKAMKREINTMMKTI